MAPSPTAGQAVSALLYTRQEATASSGETAVQGGEGLQYPAPESAKGPGQGPGQGEVQMGADQGTRHWMDAAAGKPEVRFQEELPNST